MWIEIFNCIFAVIITWLTVSSSLPAITKIGIGIVGALLVVLGITGAKIKNWERKNNRQEIEKARKETEKVLSELKQAHEELRKIKEKQDEILVAIRGDFKREIISILSSVKGRPKLTHLFETAKKYNKTPIELLSALEKQSKFDSALVSAVIGDYDTAYEMFLENASRKGEDAILNELFAGNMLFYLGNYKEADKTYQKILKVHPGYKNALHNMEMIEIKTKKDLSMKHLVPPSDILFKTIMPNKNYSFDGYLVRNPNLTFKGIGGKNMRVMPPGSSFFDPIKK